MRVKQSKVAQDKLDRETRQKEAERRRKQQFKEILRFATTAIEKIVAKDASESENDDAWTYIEQVSQHGCSSGIVSDLIYTSDTVKFYQKHKAEIWQQLYEDAENAGETVMAYIAATRWGEQITDEDTFENNLAWFGYEAACQRLLDRKENGDVPDEGAEGVE